MDVILGSLGQLLSGWHLLFLVLGVLLGLSVGLIPGLGGLAGMAMILPFLFHMDMGTALALMIGLTSVTTTSDTFPSVLMGVPGTSGSQATVMDGFPLSKQGEAARALSAAFTASLIGGVFGALVLTGAVFVAKPIILAIGFGEQLMLVLLALTMVGMLTGASPIKGMAACGLGLLVGAVGTVDTTGTMRMGFDLLYLTDGVPLVAMALGIFAVPEVIDVLRHRSTIASGGKLGAGWLQGVVDVLRHKWIVLRCAGIGCLIGALPGLGGTVIDWIAYGHVVQTSKNRERFGHGDIRGVLAPESANNAKEGGALIPTLLFGIPGSGTMVILLGGLLIIGLEPGPSMFARHLDLVFLIIWSIALANVMGTSICMGLARPISLLTTVRYTLIAPLIFSAVFFAVFQATRDWGDLIALFIAGALGVFMKRFGWSRAAFLLGYVLSDKVEEAIYQTVQAYGFTVFERPLVLILAAVVLISGFFVLRSKNQQAAKQDTGKNARRNVGPQLLFIAAMTAIPVWGIVDTAGRVYSMSLFPVSAAIFTLVFIALVTLSVLFKRAPNAELHDEENATVGRASVGSFYYLGWLAGLLAGAALLGFVPAVALFIFLFLRRKADLSIARAAVFAGLFVLVLGGFAKLLVLDYPAGLLQNFVTLPWPLQ